MKLFGKETQTDSNKGVWVEPPEKHADFFFFFFFKAEMLVDILACC